MEQNDASLTNLDAKMKEMQGYSFNHNENYVAMHKVLRQNDVEPN